MYKIVLIKPAEKNYVHLYRTDKAIFQRIRNALHALAQDPYQGKRLRFDLKGTWSYRVGPYRILYSIERHILTVYVLDIDHRREIYR